MRASLVDCQLGSHRSVHISMFYIMRTLKMCSYFLVVPLEIQLPPIAPETTPPENIPPAKDKMTPWNLHVNSNHTHVISFPWAIVYMHNEVKMCTPFLNAIMMIRMIVITMAILNSITPATIRDWLEVVR